MTAIGALLTAIGIAAAVIARVGVARAARGGGVAGHLARLLTLIALLLALRLAGFALPSPVVTALTMAVAAWLPLMTLRLAEELVRRHAPRAVKLLALGGAGAFTFLAVTFGLVWTGPALIALALFQAAVIAAILLHLLRQRASVSLAERRAADMLALAFGLALPLLATDFAWAFPGLPFRGGPFAALVFVLACSRLAGRASRPLRLLGDLALAVGAGGLAALSAQLAAAPAALAIALAATAGAAAALVLLAERFASAGTQGEALLPAIARAAPDETAILAAHPLLASAQSVSPEALADLPGDLVCALAARPVLTAARDPASDAATGAARELLARYGASHLLRLAPDATGPRFLAISGGALGEAQLTQELTLIARLLERAP
ncbi:hypothetical protein [Erythrobacter neustonensis]|uniref:Uncharacterized protein n=1 Tax=Erythrobacter neustonensis TaxID=1112 RepID=A0A192D354_9SPHN|nr:hypothetical protein [Erythrobacter neustonensis]ANK12535.1 hypothetical protein A9D12_05765 [Erythrobacter neustonensis]